MRTLPVSCGRKLTARLSMCARAQSTPPRGFAPVVARVALTSTCCCGGMVRPQRIGVYSMSTSSNLEVASQGHLALPASTCPMSTLWLRQRSTRACVPLLQPPTYGVCRIEVIHQASVKCAWRQHAQRLRIAQASAIPATDSLMHFSAATTCDGVSRSGIKNRCTL